MKFDFEEYEIGYEEMLAIFEAAESSLSDTDKKNKIMDILLLSPEQMDKILYKVRSVLSDEYS